MHFRKKKTPSGHWIIIKEVEQPCSFGGNLLVEAERIPMDGHSQADRFLSTLERERHIRIRSSPNNTRDEDGLEI